jgi:hypothetical protein
MLFEVAEELVGPGHEHAARVGQLEPPPDLAKQLDAGLALERGQVLRDRRGREGERRGRPRNRPLGGELAQHREPAWVEHRLSITARYSAELIA